MKIKGHSKIELRDAKTGIITDVREQDNFVTEFPSELFKQMGYSRPNAFANRESNILDDLFGGIMCFDTAITENADMTGRHPSPLYAPADKNMTANGSVMITSNKTPSELGQYNTNESVVSDGFVRRYVYDWDTNEGNGSISSVCLTSKYGGYVGTGNHTSGTADRDTLAAFPMELNPATSNENVQATIYSGTSRLAYINWSSNIIGIIQGLDFAQGVLVIAEYDANMVSVNPFKNLNNIIASRKIREVTYNFTPITDSISGWYTYSRFWYFGFVTYSSHGGSDNKVNVLKFNLDNTQEQYRFINMPFGYINSNVRYGRMSFAFLGDYFIAINGIQGNYVGSANIMAANTSTGVVTNLGHPINFSAGGYYNMAFVLEDRIYFNGMVIKLVNGSPVIEYTNGISITKISSSNGFYHSGQAVDSPYILVAASYESSSGDNYTFCTPGTLLRQYLATISNLQDPVVKTADKTMKITYTLTLLEQN